MHAAPLGVGDGAAKSVNYTCVNYKLDGRKATFWNEKKNKKLLISFKRAKDALPSPLIMLRSRLGLPSVAFRSFETANIKLTITQHIIRSCLRAWSSRCIVLCTKQRAVRAGWWR